MNKYRDKQLKRRVKSQISDRIRSVYTVRRPELRLKTAVSRPKNPIIRRRHLQLDESLALTRVNFYYKNSKALKYKAPAEQPQEKGITLFAKRKKLFNELYDIQIERTPNYYRIRGRSEEGYEFSRVLKEEEGGWLFDYYDYDYKRICEDLCREKL